MKKNVVAVVISALLVCGLPAFVALADDQPKEGTVVGIDKDAMLFVVRSNEGDQWTVSWATGTKPRGDLEAPELGMFDRIRFDYTERDGINWLTDLERESR